MKKFNHYRDNKVGYLRVGRDVLSDLGLTQNDISLESKVDINYVYLNELSDMIYFKQQFSKKFGTDPIIVEKVSQRCSIRNKHNNYFVK